MSDEYTVYAVQTMCRISYTIENNDTTSKRKSALWAIKDIYTNDRSLIQETFEWRKGDTFKCRKEGLVFIKEVVEKYLD